jgi:3',5'-cyclic AMP phosphodiesterase CpdA
MKRYSLKNFRTQQLVFAAITLLLSLAALWQLFTLNIKAPERLGFLLIWCAVFVFIQSFSRISDADRRRGRASALITMLMGTLLVNSVYLVENAMATFFVALIIADALRWLLIIREKRIRGEPSRRFMLLLAGDVLVLLAMLFFQRKGIIWVLSIASAMRMFGMAIEMLSGEVGLMASVGGDVLSDLSLPDNPEVKKIAERIEAEEAMRVSIDRGWIITFLVILFFIHLGRVGFDRSSTGLLSPFVAMAGDVVVSLIIAFFLIMPLKGVFRGVTRPLERRLWNWVLLVPLDQRKKWYSPRGLVQRWLEFRLRLGIRVRKSGYSFPTAIRSGLQTGLPFAALLAAIIPVFGMSWYFDTENWASGIWDSWAAARADKWRQAMVESIEPDPDGKSFMLKPAGVSDTGSFSFIVLGDPGEGDASQYVLHDQLVKTTARPEVKFMVISSDVVYPDGAMKDYEKNFWLAMKGISKPVYAIPGNHDWYDALEGFAATFYTPASARKAMLARREADLKLTTTNTRLIDDQIGKAAFLREQYRVPTGYQSTPFFQVQTKDFAFITVETGVLRQIDTVQMTWLKQVLEASKDKFIFVLLGHPFYAIGEYQGSMTPDFQRLHEMLKAYGARVMMAGDTHDLEYYLEPSKGQHKAVHHFVNGGGGAYLSVGAAMKPKDQMPEKVWAHYPAYDPLVQKIEANNNFLKKPAWVWTKKYNGWPFSAEWLSAAFDYNQAPFFQSFMEVSVEPKLNRVRLLAYGIHGPLTWGEMEKSEGLRPAGKTDQDHVEWIFSMR